MKTLSEIMDARSEADGAGRFDFGMVVVTVLDDGDIRIEATYPDGNDEDSGTIVIGAHSAAAVGQCLSRMCPASEYGLNP